MKTTKKIISLFLAALMACSCLTVGFTAFAADGESTKDAAVLKFEEKSQSFYDNHRKVLYSSKEEDAEAKVAARAAFDDMLASLKALTVEQKLQLSPEMYAYWVAYAQNDIANPTTGNATAAQKVEVLNNKTAYLEALVGELLTPFKDAIKAYEPMTRKVDGTYEIGNTKCNFKDNAEAQKAVSDLLDNVSKLDAVTLNYADTLAFTNGTNGVYVLCSDFTAGNYIGKLAANVRTIVFNEQQDIIGSGANPASVYASKYVSKTKNADGVTYTYAWKTGATAESYVNGFKAYYDATIADIIKPSETAKEMFNTAFSSADEYKVVGEVVDEALVLGLRVYNGESITAQEIDAVQSKIDSFTSAQAEMYKELGTNNYTYCYAAALINPYDASTLTPEMAYDKATSVKKYSYRDIWKMATDVVEQEQLDAFNEFVESVDLTAVTEADREQGRALYQELNTEFRGKIAQETFEKFTAIEKATVGTDDKSAEIAAFDQTDFVRPYDSKVAWTVEGIQSAVDGLWDLVANSVVPLINRDIDLSNGLDKVLEENVYTNEMVSKIFDLYAMLSRDETVVNESPEITLATVVNDFVASPSKISSALVEDKFDKAQVKIDEAAAFEEQTDENGEVIKNKLEYLSEMTFVSGDFGFEDGDREGFLNALLAVLRPVTQLLDPDASILIISVNVKMFDYIDKDGNYIDGVYSRLTPLLEQIGCTDLMTSADYEDNYYTAIDAEVAAGRTKTQAKAISADQFLRPIVDSVVKNVLDVVSPDPLNGLIKVLPRLGYVVGSGLLDDSVQSAFTQLGVLSGLGASLDLSADSINNMITAQPIDLTGVAGSDCKIQLKAIDWNALGNCATVSACPSNGNYNNVFVLRTGETDSCFSTVMYYLYDVLFADANNYVSVKVLLNSVLGSMPASISEMVLGATDRWVQIGSEKTYGEILDTLGTPGPTPIEKPQPTPDPEPTPVPVPDNTNNNTNTNTNTNTTPTPVVTAPTVASVKLTATSYTYNKKVRKPGVKAVDTNGNVIPSSCYTVAYSKGRKNVGKYAVKVTFKNGYTGTKKLYFTITPKKTSVKKIKASKKSMKVYWSKVSSQTSGYQISYSTSKKFAKSKTKTVTVKGAKNTSKTVKKLKGSKKYFVRVRTYKTVKFAGKTIKVYSGWSKTKAVYVRK